MYLYLYLYLTSFSWDEMAQYDLPALINYILNITNYEQIVYIAYSQGTLIGFAKFSEDKEFAKKVLNEPCFMTTTVKYKILGKTVYRTCTDSYPRPHHEPIPIHSSFDMGFTSKQSNLRWNNYYVVNHYVLNLWQLGLTVTGDQSFGDVKRLFKLIRKGFQTVTKNECYNPFFYFSGPGSTVSINKVIVILVKDTFHSWN